MVCNPNLRPYTKQMRIKFDLSNPERPNSTIRMRVTLGGQRSSISTGLTIPPALWSSNHRVKTGLAILAKYDMTVMQANFINNRLDLLQGEVVNAVTRQLADGNADINVDLVRSHIRRLLGGEQPRSAENNSLVTAMHCYIEHLKTAKGRNGQTTSPNTLKAYNRALNAMSNYEGVIKRSIDTTHVDREFHRTYINHMGAAGYKPSYASKIMDCVKAALKWAEDQGQPIHADVRNGKLAKIQPKKWRRATLSTDELKHLMTLDLKGKLEKTRDLLVIGCWTALRVSDLMKLGGVKVHKDEDGEFIQVESTKVAGTFIEVPLHDHVQAIRGRWQGWPPAISDQRFNEYVKELCKLAGMTEPMQGEVAKVVEVNGKATKRNVPGTYQKWELISSHTCRRSFATNFYGAIPTGDIMHVTGHASEKQLMEYIHAKPIDTRRRVRAAMSRM